MMPADTPGTHRSVLDYENEDDLINALKQACTIRDSSEGLSQGPASPDWVLPVYDPETTLQACPKSEVERLKALKSYLILDSEREEAFDRLAEEVRSHYKVPWTCISFVDLGRQWLKSLQHDDLDLQETSRQDAFCAHTILQKERGLLIVPDALQDERFRENPLVTGQPHLRFYAGAPIVSPEGHELGSLGLLDKKPRPHGLNHKEQEFLRQKAAEVVKLLVERRNRLETQRKRTASESNTKLPRMDSDEPCRALQPRVNQSAKKHRPESTPSQDEHEATNAVIPRPRLDVSLPDHKSSGVSPDEYLAQLTEALLGVSVKVKPALELQDFFLTITEEQMAAYDIEIVSATRENKVEKLRSFYEIRGRESLDCFNRFGEGLLNMACRRGFKEIVRFLLSDQVNLSVRICDDYGRTPMHDACWNPEPQLEICSWIMAKDPSIFLISDKRGYTPFQYARKSDWHVWRQFLYENRHLLEGLTRPEILSKFS